MIRILSQSGNRVAYGACAWAFSLCLCVCGCGIPNPKAFVPPGTLPYRDIAATYHSSSIKRSSTLDVLRRRDLVLFDEGELALACVRFL